MELDWCCQSEQPINQLSLWFWLKFNFVAWLCRTLYNKKNNKYFLRPNFASAVRSIISFFSSLCIKKSLFCLFKRSIKDNKKHLKTLSTCLPSIQKLITSNITLAESRFHLHSSFVSRISVEFHILMFKVWVTYYLYWLCTWHLFVSLLWQDEKIMCLVLYQHIPLRF